MPILLDGRRRHREPHRPTAILNNHRRQTWRRLWLYRARNLTFLATESRIHQALAAVISARGVDIKQ